MAWGQRSEYFSRAIAIDPAYAEASWASHNSYAVSGDWKYAYSPQDAFSKATAAAAEALASDGTLGEAHAPLAFALDLYGWDWTAAEIQAGDSTLDSWLCDGASVVFLASFHGWQE